MHLLTRGRVISIFIVAALLAINVVALRWSSHFFSSDRPRVLLKYGDRIPDLKGKSLTGQGTLNFTKNRPNLVLYFSLAQPPGFSTELVKYAEILSQRHKKDGLVITAIVEQEIAELRSLMDHALVAYDVIIDEKGEIQEQLGLQFGQDGVFFFDREGICRFATHHKVSAGDLRQLTAVEFLKVDPFAVPSEAESILKEGSSLGSFSLMDARSMKPAAFHEIRSRAGTPTHYVFFTAACSVCSLPQYLEQYRAFRLNHLERDDDAVLIFDFNFPRTHLIDELKSNDIRTPAYIAKGQLPELEFTDQRDRLREKTVAVIQTDAQKRILKIYPLISQDVERDRPTASATRSQSQRDPAGATYEEMFTHIPFTAYDVATYQGKYFLTDFDGNRIVVINGNMEMERDFARIGSGPGRLFNPGYLDISPDGTIFVQDGGNERIVRFDHTGKYLGEFPIADYQGLAVGPRNELYLGQPEEGHLITVYSSSGKKLRSFGQLKKFSDVHGESFRDKDEPYKIAFNRVRLATDKEGNLYVSFMLTPLIQKYSPDGALLFEKRLQAPEIDRLTEAVQQKRYIATKSDGADARVVALDPVIDPANKNIMVPLVDGSIYVADREGNKIALLRPSWTSWDDDGTFYPFIAGLGANGELMVTTMPPKRWYRLAVRKDISNSIAAFSIRESAVGTR